MARTAIATDSNSGITQSQAKELGVFVLPMPFFMRGKIQFEDIDLTQEQFYEILAEDAAVSTSQRFAVFFFSFIMHSPAFHSFPVPSGCRTDDGMLRSVPSVPHAFHSIPAISQILS